MADEFPEFISPPPPPERPLRASRNPLDPPPPQPPGPPPPPPRRTLSDWLGVRAARRPEPRFGVSLAGAGALMVVFGCLSIGGDQLASSGGDDGSQLPGLFITGAVLAIGIALTAQYKHGPMAAAGVGSSVIALPPFVFFLTFTRSSAPPFATILILSSLGWAAGYLFGPGRGHNLSLSAALLGAWLWFIETTEHLFSFPGAFLFNLVEAASSSGFDTSSSSSFGTTVDAPSATNIGTYSIAFAAVYLATCVVFDRRDQRGIATPFAFGGIVTLVVGILALSGDLQQVGTGIAFTLAGLLLLYGGATGGRRGTNWTGAGLVFLGLTLIVADPFDTATAFGFAEIVAALTVVYIAHLVSTQFQEPPETEPVPSTFQNVGSTQAGPPAPPPPAGAVLG